jgi:hypothetical protein
MKTDPSFPRFQQPLLRISKAPRLSLPFLLRVRRMTASQRFTRSFEGRVNRKQNSKSPGAIQIENHSGGRCGPESGDLSEPEAHTPGSAVRSYSHTKRRVLP